MTIVPFLKRQAKLQLLPGTTRLISIALLLGISGCQSIEEILTKLPRPDAATPQPSIVLPPAQSTATAQMEAQIRQRINQIRQQQGLSPLRENEKLAQVARQYSKRMAAEKFFSHTSPSGDTMVQRVGAARIFYVILGENLFRSSNITEPVPVAVKGWMDSPGHRANILRSEYRETGIGVWRNGNDYYFTQLFLRSWR
jgi:uncharacterized protein YkwD